MLERFIKSKDAASRVPAESNVHLQGILETLGSWPKLTFSHLGPTSVDPYDLPLEMSVSFTGPSSGFLNIRTTHEMPKSLLPPKTKTSSAADEIEAFCEFMVIFTSRLMIKLLDKDTAKLQKNTPQFTTLLHWPKSEPIASCAFIVDDCPFEIRFWINKAV
jgi:hypothetical protein